MATDPNNLPVSKRPPRITDGLELKERRERMQVWLAAFASHGNVTLACKQAGVPRSSYYHWMVNCGDAESPNPSFSLEDGNGGLVTFKELAEVAANEAADLVEEEIRRRAVEGTIEPVFGTLGEPEVVTDAKGNEKTVVRKYTGKVGEVRKFSDILLIFLAKGLRPNKWRENVKVEHDVKVIDIDSARNRLADKLLQAIERRELAARLENPGQPNPDGLLNAGAPEVTPLLPDSTSTIDLAPLPSAAGERVFEASRINPMRKEPGESR